MTNTRSLDPARESFHKFFECWLAEQNQHLRDLINASKLHNHTSRNNHVINGNTTTCTNASSTSIGPLVERVLKHYEHYYEAKSIWVKHNVLEMLSPSWRSSLEDAFLWIGGWRPSMAFHLFYSKSGLQLEDRLSELIRGVSTGDLADLSPCQLTQVDQLQIRTLRDEKDVTEKMAKQQEKVADASMVELSHVITEMIMSAAADDNGHDDHQVEEDQRVETTLASKEQGLEEILQRADDLRLRTLKSITHILTPIQAVHFLIAAAELHLRLHDWGKKKDATSHGHSSQL